MFRLWGKLFKENRMIKDTVICIQNNDLSRTAKIFDAIEQICIEFDLSKPIWLDANITEFKRHDKVRFNHDNFIETIEFDYLELQVLEE